MDNVRQEDHVSKLKEEIIHLGPWHIDVQVTPEVSTSAFLDAPEGTYTAQDKKVTFVSPRKSFEDLLRQVYPNGLEGRTFLECACNCGAYCFWAREMGASRCFGFDVREHWIDQARFLKENRTVGPTDGVDFDLRDLYKLPETGLEPFDITMFQGIFYHLPDPITGLKAAADLTKELLLLDTASRNGMPDGMLAIAEESKDPVMSGVYGLNWFPTGPEVLRTILSWMGFPETRLIHWRTQRQGRRSEIGRIRMLASRTEGLLENVRSAETPETASS